MEKRKINTYVLINEKKLCSDNGCQNMTTLANAFGVSRQCLHKWKSVGVKYTTLQKYIYNGMSVDLDAFILKY